MKKIQVVEQDGIQTTTPKDTELENAKNVNEKEQYYRVKYGLTRISPNGEHHYQYNAIKLYKPSVAKLYAKRTGYIFEPFIPGEN